MTISSESRNYVGSNRCHCIGDTNRTISYISRNRLISYTMWIKSIRYIDMAIVYHARDLEVYSEL